VCDKVDVSWQVDHRNIVKWIGNEFFNIIASVGLLGYCEISAFRRDVFEVSILLSCYAVEVGV
jgi:hypothetical protein